jgi:hypothetical protein
MTPSPDAGARQHGPAGSIHRSDEEKDDDADLLSASQEGDGRT